MQGTPKQIAWAEKIKRGYSHELATARRLIDLFMKNETRPKGQQIFAAASVALAKIEQQDDAAWWIKNGKDNHDVLMQDSPLYLLRAACVLSETEAKMIVIVMVLQKEG